MADYAITDTAVLPGSGAVQEAIVAGEALVAGTPFYIKAADSKAYKADANVTVAEATVKGVTTNNAAAGQRVSYVGTGNRVTVNAVLGVGDVVYLSAAAGKLAPDVPATGSFITILGVAESATSLPLNIINSGIQKP